MRIIPLIIAFLMSFIHAGEITETPIQSAVIDDAGLFTHYPEEKKQLEQKILAYQEKYHLPLFVYIASSTKNTNSLDKKATLKRKQYLNDQLNGCLIFYEPDSALFALCINKMNIINDGETLTKLMIPTHDEGSLRNDWGKRILATMHTDDFNYQSRTFNPRVSCPRLVDAWCHVSGEYFDKKLKGDQGKSKDMSYLKNMLKILGVGLVLALTIFLFRWKRQEKNSTTNGRYYFPIIPAKLRLGARYSGGKSVVRKS